MNEFTPKYTLSQLSNLYGDLILCSDCGYYSGRDSMFIKQYQGTAFCLCKKCAVKLRDAIDEKLGNNNNKCRSLTDSEQRVYNDRLKADSKVTGVKLF